MNALNTKPQSVNSTVLALYPNSRGIAYAVMDSPSQLVESGIKAYSPICNTKCILQANVYFDYFKPDIVILEDTDSKKCASKPRVSRLIKRLAERGAKKGLRIVSYTREHICTLFELQSGTTKHHINTAIVKLFPNLAEKQPEKRKLGVSEDYFQGEFDAISLALTHYYQQG